MIDLIKAVEEAGFPYHENVIDLFVGGSQLHGAKLEGTDDVDIYGIFIEPRVKVLGLDRYEHFVWSTAEQGDRNTAADTDITLYSLRKFAALACKGNPTALHFLFALNVAQYPQFWNALVPEIKSCVLSRDAASQFTGFVDAQMGRLLGTRGRGKKGQRPELEEKYGYDTKAAMHAVRLLFECVELMNDATITFPRPEQQMLVDIRSGKWSLDHVCQEVSKLREMVDRAMYHSLLGDEPNREKLNEIISSTYMKYWRSEEGNRQEKRSNRERTLAAKKKAEDDCPHLAGSFAQGSVGSHLTCIIWHTFEDDPIHAVGICIHCGKQWRHNDADYQFWKDKPSMNTPSSGGLHVLPSTALPHMPGTKPLPGPGLYQERGWADSLKVDSLDNYAYRGQPEVEPPIKLSLKEFIISEALKRDPESAARILSFFPHVVQDLKKGGLV